MSDTETITDSNYHYFVNGKLVTPLRTGWEFLDEPEEDIYEEM